MEDPDCEIARGHHRGAARAPAAAERRRSVPSPAPLPPRLPTNLRRRKRRHREGTAASTAAPAARGPPATTKLGDASGGGSNGARHRPERQRRRRPADLAEGSDGGSQYTDGGAPTAANPTTTIAPFGPAPIGVPNFVIDSFEIPPFLLPIYQACGTEYGIPWEVLASINKIETGFGTNLNVSSAGAVGWMQFLPSSWEAFGLDANGDGRKDPYNPVDAICAAAHYLKLAGGNKDLYQAIFAYNHADWYVQEVLLYARAYGRLPSDLVGSLTGLTEGAHFPIAADARYADDIAARAAMKKRRAAPNTATPPKSSPPPPPRAGSTSSASRGRRSSPSTTG